MVFVNEVVDRNFFDHRNHIDGDILLGVAGVAIAFFASYFVERLSSRRAA